MSNFTEKSLKFHGEGGGQQPLFQDASLMQTKKSVELQIDISEQRIFIIVIKY